MTDPIDASSRAAELEEQQRRLQRLQEEQQRAAEQATETGQVSEVTGVAAGDDVGFDEGPSDVFDPGTETDAVAARRAPLPAPVDDVQGLVNQVVDTVVDFVATFPPLAFQVGGYELRPVSLEGFTESSAFDPNAIGTPDDLREQVTTFVASQMEAAGATDAAGEPLTGEALTATAESLVDRLWDVPGVSAALFAAVAPAPPVSFNGDVFQLNEAAMEGAEVIELPNDGGYAVVVETSVEELGLGPVDPAVTGTSDVGLTVTFPVDAETAAAFSPSGTFPATVEDAAAPEAQALQAELNGQLANQPPFQFNVHGYQSTADVFDGFTQNMMSDPRWVDGTISISTTGMGAGADTFEGSRAVPLTPRQASFETALVVDALGLFDSSVTFNGHSMGGANLFNFAADLSYLVATEGRTAPDFQFNLLAPALGPDSCIFFDDPLVYTGLVTGISPPIIAGPVVDGLMPGLPSDVADVHTYFRGNDVLNAQWGGLTQQWVPSPERTALLYGTFTVNAFLASEDHLVNTPATEQLLLGTGLPPENLHTYDGQGHYVLLNTQGPAGSRGYVFAPAANDWFGVAYDARGEVAPPVPLEYRYTAAFPRQAGHPTLSYEGVLQALGGGSLEVVGEGTASAAVRVNDLNGVPIYELRPLPNGSGFVVFSTDVHGTATRPMGEIDVNEGFHPTVEASVASPTLVYEGTPSAPTEVVTTHSGPGAFAAATATATATPQAPVVVSTPMPGGGG